MDIETYRVAFEIAYQNAKIKLEMVGRPPKIDVNGLSYEQLNMGAQWARAALLKAIESRDGECADLWSSLLRALRFERKSRDGIKRYHP